MNTHCKSCEIEWSLREVMRKLQLICSIKISTTIFVQNESSVRLLKIFLSRRSTVLLSMFCKKNEMNKDTINKVNKEKFSPKQAVRLVWSINDENFFQLSTVICLEEGKREIWHISLSLYHSESARGPVVHARARVQEVQRVNDQRSVSIDRLIEYVVLICESETCI